MLDNCIGLSECEILLTELVNHVQILGEIPLTDQDIEKLAVMVRTTIALNITRGTRILKTKYPVSFACLLVGIGRFYDKEIGFWPIVENKVGTIDINWKSKWGKIFLRFLEQYGLPKFDEEEGLAYVTPILSHTCIPNSCLNEYFDQVLVPLVIHELLNPFDAEEITHDLRAKRKLNNERLILDHKNKQLLKTMSELRDENRHQKKLLGVYEAINRLISAETECEGKRIALNGLEDANKLRTGFLDQINAAAKKIKSLETEGKRKWSEVESLQRKCQPVLEHRNEIDEIIRCNQNLTSDLHKANAEVETLFAQVTAQWISLSNLPWEDHYGAEVVEVPLDKVLTLIEQVQFLEEHQKKIGERIEFISALKKPARKRPPFFLIPFILVWNLFFRVDPKPQKQPSNELQDLRNELEKTRSELLQKQNDVRALLEQLPIGAQKLGSPDISLIDKIATVREIYLNLQKTRDTRLKLEQKIVELLKRARVLGVSLGINDEWQAGSWFDLLAASLAEVIPIQEQIQNIRHILEDQIRPALEAGRTEYQRLQGKLKSLDERLSDIGDGSIDLGLSRVKEFNQFREAIEQERKNLQLRYPNFTSMENELRRDGLEPIRVRIEAAVARNAYQVQQVREELECLEQGLSRYPAQYIGIDEPIRRFLLYGGATAERILLGSVFLFAKAKAGENRENITETGLPERVI